IYAYGGAQDTIGAVGVYNLGNRQPTGSGPGSMSLVGVASTYAVSPASYCTIHDMGAPSGGWVKWISNDARSYTATLSSGALNNTPGDATHGLNACPTNNVGVAGNVCTTVTLSGQLTNGGVSLQNVQLGDLWCVGGDCS